MLSHHLEVIIYSAFIQTYKLHKTINYNLEKSLNPMTTQYRDRNFYFFATWSPVHKSRKYVIFSIIHTAYVNLNRDICIKTERTAFSYWRLFLKKLTAKTQGDFIFY